MIVSQNNTQAVLSDSRLIGVKSRSLCSLNKLTLTALNSNLNEIKLTNDTM